MTENFWDKIANKYDNRTNKVYENANKKVVVRTIGYCSKDKRLLDIGCGTGVLTRELEKYVEYVDAIDSSLEMLEIARNNAEKEKIKNINWENQNIINNSINSKYNIITAFNLLLYIDNPKDLIANIYENLCDEGYFISVTDCLGEEIKLLNRIQLFLSKCGILPHVNLFKEKGLVDIIVNSGFEIKVEENVHTIPSNYYIVAKKINKRKILS